MTPIVLPIDAQLLWCLATISIFFVLLWHFFHLLEEAFSWWFLWLKKRL